MCPFLSSNVCRLLFLYSLCFLILCYSCFPLPFLVFPFAFFFCVQFVRFFPFLIPWFTPNFLPSIPFTSSLFIISSFSSFLLFPFALSCLRFRLSFQCAVCLFLFLCVYLPYVISFSHSQRPFFYLLYFFTLNYFFSFPLPFLVFLSASLFSVQCVRFFPLMFTVCRSSLIFSLSLSLFLFFYSLCFLTLFFFLSVTLPI